MSDQKHHGIDYIEFTVSDIEQAKAFYTGSFGWTFKDYGPDYSGIEIDGVERGGLTRGETKQQGGPLVVLFSDDLDASKDSVVAAGGKIAKEPFDFPGGRRFEFLDPSGNRLGVWATV